MSAASTVAVAGLLVAIGAGVGGYAYGVGQGKALQKGQNDAAALQAQAAEPAVKDALKATTEEAVKRGVFGAPTCFVGGEMFFGQDRLDFVREALRG